MPRIAVSPADYLDALEKGRAAAAPGTVVNATEFARAAGVTWRILERWVVGDAAFPAIERGRMGAPWRFDLVAGLDYLIGRARALRAEREARGADVARLAGFGGAEGVAPSPGVSAGPGAAADRAADARALNALADARIKTHRLAREQGDVVLRSATEALLADLMSTMQTETLAIAADLDQAGAWPPKLRADVESALRTVLTKVQDRLTKRLPDWRQSARP